MSEDTFIAQTLNSNQLLALLFICEAKRKGLALDSASFKAKPPPEWEESLATFAVRFANLTETMRFEVLEAHLMSVEDIDVYNNQELQTLIQTNKTALDFLTTELDQDSRFKLF